MEIVDKHILVVGLGKSGVATARFLRNRGARVTVTDMASEDQLGEHAQMMREMGISLVLGEHRTETFASADGIVISPGVPHTLPPIKAAEERGIPVMGEIELASRFIQEPIIAVTGTNGKTTTTTLLGEMLEASGFEVFVGGNIGNPLITYADSGQRADRIVVEVSSFQLDTINTFRPKVAVLLNITADHLDRYPDFTAYAKSKARIFENQEPDDFAVLNSDDPVVHSVTQNIKGRKFETGNWKLETGNWKFETGNLKFETGNLKFETGNWKLETGSKFQVSSFKFQAKFLGKHNLENASAACLATWAADGTEAGIQSALNDFKGLPHRLEHVAKIKGIMYVNDSKATNTDAVAKALESFDKPVILIMGGRGKGNGFHILKEPVRRHVKKLIAIGETKADIISVLGDECRDGSQAADSMEDAVLQAYRLAEPGDVVLLSPACSSFDMYRSYTERGDAFRQAVNALTWT